MADFFRILVVDIGACVLDMAKSAWSVASIIKELTGGTRSLDALKAYYADPNCLVAKIESGTLTSAEAEFACEHAIKRNVVESLKSLDSQWKGIKSKRTEVLESTAAKRMKWARNKLVAHFEKSTKGIVPLDAPPPYGNGNLTWLEPVSFIDFVRPFVYGVFELVTSTSWAEDYIDMNRFYARAFWDRLKNGKTLLKYEPGRERP